MQLDPLTAVFRGRTREVEREKEREKPLWCVDGWTCQRNTMSAGCCNIATLISSLKLALQQSKFP